MLGKGIILGKVKVENGPNLMKSIPTGPRSLMGQPQDMTKVIQRYIAYSQW